MDRSETDVDQAKLAGRTLVAILAAGAGSRFTASAHASSRPAAGPASDVAGTRHKLLQLIVSESGSTTTVLEQSVANATGAAVGPVLVVSGAADLTGLDLGAGTMIVHNERWSRGQATSVATATDFAHDGEYDAVVIGLGDQPGITPAAWRNVASTDSPIAVATYDGVRGNPVRLAAEVWPMLDTEGDAGARTLMRVRSDLVTEVPCPGSAADIDTVEDLRRWQRS